MNYYISDLHFFHNNIIKFDSRPFSSLEEMHDTIIKNWNNRVTKEDTVYILGDFCWGKEPEWLSIINKLNGHKVLIRGNHDLKKMSAALRNKFLDVKDYKEVTDNGRRVIMSHYPMPMYRGAYNPQIYMLYGHVHTTREEGFMSVLRETLKSSYCNRGDNLGQFYNVGCMLPYMDFTPKTLDEIIEGAEL